jgi:hypothetical protein
MHVISASRRTDIPAFHTEWFMNRIAEGRVVVRSPFGRGTFEVSLRVEDVIALVFWTKNAGPLISSLDELQDRGYCFTFLYTINRYPRELEPYVPDFTRIIRTVETIGQRFPDAMVRWRYDTIVLTPNLDAAWHRDNFRFLCERLSGLVNECIFSFCDYYLKTIRIMDRSVPDHIRPDEDVCVQLAQELAGIASDHRIVLSSCSHDHLVRAPIAKARCIARDVLATVVNTPERARAIAGLKAAPSRKGCGCIQSRDIGAYDTCGHGCVYCYANRNPAEARNASKLVSPAAACLDPTVADGNP